MKIFQGSAVALVTPFDKSGEINFKSFERLLEFHLENNTQAKTKSEKIDIQSR